MPAAALNFSLSLAEFDTQQLLSAKDVCVQAYALQRHSDHLQTLTQGASSLLHSGATSQQACWLLSHLAPRCKISLGAKPQPVAHSQYGPEQLACCRSLEHFLDLAQMTAIGALCIAQSTALIDTLLDTFCAM